MTAPLDASQHPDSMPVQLARMEGTLNLVADRVSGLSGRVDKHEVDIAELKSHTQALAGDAKAEAVKAIALAAALKEADEARRQKSEQTWSPFAKSMAALAAFVGLVSLMIQLGWIKS